MTLASGATENIVSSSGSSVIGSKVLVGEAVGVVAEDSESVEVVVERVEVGVGVGVATRWVVVGSLPPPMVIGGGAGPSQVTPRGQHAPPTSHTLLRVQILARDKCLYL